jgi:polar amino acid transport system substrate-binding protein
MRPSAVTESKEGDVKKFGLERTRTGAGITAGVTAILALALLVGVASAAATKKTPRDMLPAKIKKAGVIHVATSIYAPVDYYKKDGKTLTGFDADIMNAAAKVLHVKVKWSVIDFSAILPGITSGQYDFATDLTDTKAREKTVDFVDNYRDGTSILVAHGNPEHLTNLGSLCGKTVVMTQGSVQIPLATAQSTKCTSAGKKAINQLIVADDPPARLALKSGQADAYLANTLASSYAAKTTTDFQVLPGVYAFSYDGDIFPKKSKQLRNAVTAAFNVLVKNGTYGRIMKKYGLKNNEVKHVTINVAGK